MLPGASQVASFAKQTGVGPTQEQGGADTHMKRFCCTLDLLFDKSAGSEKQHCSTEVLRTIHPASAFNVGDNWGMLCSMPAAVAKHVHELFEGGEGFTDWAREPHLGATHGGTACLDLRSAYANRMVVLH